MDDVVNSQRKKWPADNDVQGFACSQCGCCDIRVDGTRKARRMVVRYRRCRNCGKRMTTCERPAVPIT